jgi:hypothetical protein
MPISNHTQPSALRTPTLGSSIYLRHDRFFHVMNQGWYVEVRNGTAGPFETQEEADTYLQQLIAQRSAAIDSKQNETLS